MGTTVSYTLPSFMQVTCISTRIIHLFHQDFRFTPSSVHVFTCTAHRIKSPVSRTSSKAICSWRQLYFNHSQGSLPAACYYNTFSQHVCPINHRLLRLCRLPINAAYSSELSLVHSSALETARSDVYNRLYIGQQ